jgi:murein L,D-transpeptidase YcbB/YkuD
LPATRPAADAPPAEDPDWHIPLATDAGEPDHPGYARLKAARDHYAALAAAGGWAEVPPGPELSLGQRDARVVDLRRRLRQTGDFRDLVQADAWLFDTAMAEALGRFQFRHGIPVTGILDARTWEQLDVPLAVRLQQIEATLVRWRWLPRSFEARHVWVNIPAATLEVRNGNRVELAMRVILGHPERPTPSFKGNLGPVTFHPTWTVPLTIAVEDLLPLQRQDPEFLSRQKIRVYRGNREIPPGQVDWSRLGRDHFPYRLVQDPGPANSLGRVKIGAGNPFDIFLHDTPSALFDLSYRTLGSGCIRLEEPEALATLLLAAGRDWTPEDTRAALDRPETRVLRLEKPLPLYAVYLSTWPDAEGQVHFRRDVYGWDARLIRALTAE